MLKLAFLVFINQLLQFLAEYSAVIAAHLGTTHKACLVALDADHNFLLLLLCYGNYKVSNVYIAIVNKDPLFTKQTCLKL